MARTSHSSPVERYRAEAAHALSRIRHYHAQGDTSQVEQWHQAWSLARTAIDAELREKGGGARVVRLKNPPPLRPLPEEFSAVALPPIPAPVPTHEPAVPEQTSSTSPVDPLTAALDRHRRIEEALRAGGPNPFPDELDEGQWQYHLTAFQEGGPCDCDLLQQAEAAVEALVEMLPEYWEPEEFGGEAGQEPSGKEPDPPAVPLETAALPEWVRIYRESLPELTEDELRADLETCLNAGREDTAALIEVELRHRERETAPDLTAISAATAPAGVAPAAPMQRRPRADRVGEPHPSEERPPEKASRRRGPSYTVSPVVPRSAPLKKPAAAPLEESPNVSDPAYTTAPAWIDAAGRTRTWSLFDPSGAKMAEIATRRDAEKLATLFNQIMRGEVTLHP